MTENKEDIDFERKILEMEMPLRKFVSEEEKETSWKEILLTVEGDTHKRRRAKNLYWMAAAASVLIVIGVALWPTVDSGFRTSDHEKLTIGLTDGSSVTLNYKSRLDVADDFGEKDRRVSLRGEAFFTVQKDELKPFVIAIGRHEVIVVGTSFNVNYKENLTEVTVRSGKVRLQADNRVLMLAAGEKGVISLAGELSKVKWNANDFAWYSETLILKEKSLKEIAGILSQIFNRRVEVSPAIAACTLSGKIEYETIDDILVIIEATFDVEWKVESNRIYIYGDKGC